MELLILCALLGCIPGAIASSKGRSFFPWWVYGALLFIVALIHSLCLSKRYNNIDTYPQTDGLAKCPFCAEVIRKEAIRCKHCGSDIHPQKAAIDHNPQSKWVAKDFYTFDSGTYKINGDAVSRLVERIHFENAGIQSSSLIEKYMPHLDSVISEMPPEIAKEFSRRFYTEI